MPFMALLFLWACSESSTEELVSQSEKNAVVRFDVQLMSEVLPFPATKSIPALDIPEPADGKGEEESVPQDKELADFCNTIEYILFREEESGLSFYKRKTFTPQDEDFSIVYDTLARGTYHICFVAHSSGDVTLDGQQLRFGDVGDTFYKQLPLTVRTSDEVNRHIELERIVSRVEFMSRDLVPEEASRFDMDITHWSNAFDLLSGVGVPAAEKKSFSHSFVPEEKGKENMIHSFYTFVPGEGTTLEAELAALGEGEQVLRDRTVRGITPYRNKIIRYKGLLYSWSDSEETFQLEIFNNGEWEEVQEDELPDRE